MKKQESIAEKKCNKRNGSPNDNLLRVPYYFCSENALDFLAHYICGNEHDIFAITDQDQLTKAPDHITQNF